MQRYFIELSYNGSPYHGWQVQPNAQTVQECLDNALTVYFRQPVSTLGCGRTDAGVHASQFYAHFDLLAAYEEIKEKAALLTGKWVSGVNALLPYEIAVRRIFEVAPDAHARFDATERTYHYHLHFHKDPFKRDRSWLYKGALDVTAMNEAAAALLNYTDFSCFSKSNTQTFTNNCRITAAFFEAVPDGLQFTIRADRFLRNMVRAIMGTLIKVGKKETSLAEFQQVITSGDRGKAGQSVPACGLYLVSVVYPYVK